MGLIDGLVALAVIFAFAYVLLAQAIKKNPNVSEHLKNFFSGRLFERIPFPQSNSEVVKEKIWRQKIDRM